MPLRFLFILFISQFVAIQALAQKWKLAYPTTSVNDLQAACMVDSMTGFVAGLGIISKTTNSGRTWNTVYMDDYTNISQVFFINPSTGWAGCSSYDSVYILKTTDGGENWRKTYKVYNLLDGLTVFGLTFLTDQMGWFSHKMGTYKTTDGGITWNFVSQHTPKSIQFTSPNEGWGDIGESEYDLVVAKTTNGGISWTPFAGDFGNASAGFHFISPSTGWVHQPGTGLLKTTNGGLTWDTLPFPINLVGKIIVKLHFRNALEGYFIHLENFGKWTHFYRTMDGGLSWTGVYVNVDNLKTNHFSMNAGGNGILCGKQGMVMSTSDYGATWTNRSQWRYGSLAPLGPGNMSFPSVCFTDSLNGWYNSYWGVGRTLDGGRTLQTGLVLNPILWYPDKVKFLSPKFGYILDNEGYITNDSGKTWQFIPISDPLNLSKSDLEFRNENEGWIVSRQGLLGKYKAGQGWAQVGTQRGHKICLVDSQTVILVTRNNNLNISRNDGQTWNLVNFQGNIYDVSFVGDKIGFAVGEKLYKTSDGGFTWAQIPGNTSGDRILFTDSLTGWLVNGLGNAYSKLLKTLDGGLTWIPQSFGGYSLENIFALDKNHLWVCGEKGISSTSWKRVNAAIAGPDVVEICQGESHLLTASVGAGYQWFRNGQLIAIGGKGQTYSATLPGVYVVRVQDEDLNVEASHPIQVVVNPAPPKPEISFPADSTICEGSEVIIPSNAVENIQWFRDGTPLAGANLSSITATQAGVYTVRVVPATGCPSRMSEPVTLQVNPNPNQPSVAPSPTVFCDGQPIILQSSSPTGNIWFRNGQVINGAINPTYTVADSGTYSVMVQTNGCSSPPSPPRQIQKIPVPPVPAISVLGSTILCGTPDTVFLKSSASAGNLWYRNTIPIVNASDSLYRAFSAGSYRVRVTFGACSSGLSSSYLVNQLWESAAPVVTTSGPTQFCQGDSVRLSGSISGVEYIWFRNGQVHSSGLSRSLTVTTSGTYTLRTYSPANPCSSQVSVPIQVVVNPIPAIPVLSGPASNTLCAGSSGQIVSNNSGSHFWYRNGQLLPGETNSILSISQAGSYVAKATASSCTSALSQPISIELGEQPQVTLQPQNQLVEEGSNAVFSVQATGSGLAFQWQNAESGGLFEAIPGGGQYSGINSPILTVSNVAPGNSGETFRCIVRKAVCVDTSSPATLTLITPSHQISGDEQTLAIQPNPGSNEVSFINPSQKVWEVTLLDMQGRRLFHEKELQNGPIQTAPFPAGVYIWQLKNATDLKMLKWIKN